MNKKIIILVLFITFLFSACHIPNIEDDIKLENQKPLQTGHHSICENPYLQFDCKNGLECKTVTNDPYTIKVCMRPNEPATNYSVSAEDFQ